MRDAAPATGTQDPAAGTDAAITLSIDELYIGYAHDPEVRRAAASGGIVSRILIHLLESGEIDGAIVSRIASQNGRAAAVTGLARTREQVLQHAGSSYIDTPVWQQVKALRNFDGRLAVVALPCQARLLRRKLEADAELRARVAVVISLFCRGTVTERFYEDYFRRVGIPADQVVSVKVTRSHYSGVVTVRLAGGGQRELSFAKINAFRLAGMHAKPLCLWCDEHLGEAADIAVGDIFAPEIKNRAIKHSAVIARTRRGAQILETMRRRELLKLELFGMERYRSIFSKIEAYSTNLKPRWWAARLLGLSAVGQRCWRVNPLHVVSWLLYFGGYRLTRTGWGRRLIYRLPQPCITAWALAIKVLSRL